MTGKDRMVADLKAQHEESRKKHENDKRQAQIDAKQPIVDPSIFDHLERSRRPSPPMQERPVGAQRPAQQAQRPPQQAQRPMQQRPVSAQRSAQQAQRPMPARHTDARMSAKEMAARRAEEKERAKKVAARRAAEERARAKEEAARIAAEKKELAKAQAALRAAEAKKRKEERAKKIEKIKKTLTAVFSEAAGYFGVFVCLFLIICGIAVTVFLVMLTKSEGEIVLPDKAVYYLDGEKRNLPYSDVYIDGKYYLDLSQIAREASLSVSGDSSELVFSTASGEKITLKVGSEQAIVNGAAVSMGGKSILRGNDLWVPADFVVYCINGVSFSVSDDKETISVSIEDEVSFVLKSDSPLDTPNVGVLPPALVVLPTDTPKYEFSSDLSSYYKYMDPADRDAYLVLINSSKPVDSTYVPEDLVSVVNVKKGKTAQMALYAEKALEALFVEMYAAGYTDVVVSLAYRSYEAQEKQFNIFVYNERYYYRYNFESTGKWFSDEAQAVLGATYLKEKYISQSKTVLSQADAKRVVMSYSAAPGTGDHQTGLSCDMHNLRTASRAFADEEAYEWLLKNAHKFGFILRYPEDKQKITGIGFEPYHWRFVGQYHAAIMHENGLCLEEYVAMLQKQ